jgi:hypothetical protein
MISSDSKGSQFVLFDGYPEYPGIGEHKQGGGGCFWRWWPEPDAVLNWVSPVNYKDGTAYVRYETQVLNETGLWKSRFTMWSAGQRLGYAHWLFPLSDPLVQGSVSIKESRVPDLQWDTDGAVPSDWDWTHATDNKNDQYIYCGYEEQPPRYQCSSWQNFGLPDYNTMKSIKLRITTIIVSKDGTFVPPAGWNDFNKLKLGSPAA